MAITPKMRKAILDLSNLKNQDITLQTFAKEHNISCKGLLYHINIMCQKYLLTRDELINSPKCIQEYLKYYDKPSDVAEPEAKVESSMPQKPKHYLDILYERCQTLIDETNALLNNAKATLKEEIY